MSDLPSKTERTREAMEELIRCVNTLGGEEDIAEVMASVLMGSHRTLQQSFFRTLNIALAEYQDVGTDLRNEASADFAKKVVAQEFFFPLV